MSLVGNKKHFLKTAPMSRRQTISLSLLAGVSLMLMSCADAVGPKARTAHIPPPKAAEERKTALNESGEPITYLPLGEDVLMPHTEEADPLPDTVVGPFELRGETLAGALQLILDEADVPVAFESSASLTQNITVTNLKGPMSMVVNEVCSLANMYCSYQNGVLLVKDKQVFTVTVPPIVPTTDVGAMLTNIAAAVGNITGDTPITDPSTRTIVYRASQRTADLAKRYFQRLRSNTAMIVFETYIWEVTLESGNTTGIKWSQLGSLGKFNLGIKLAGAANPDIGAPISIGLPTTGAVNYTNGDVFDFISKYGAVKTISQPQITVLSGSTAKLRVADKTNYLASISRTRSDTGNSDTVSTTTASVDSGFTLNIASNWDNSTVYGTIGILLQEVQDIETFNDNPDAVVQLPKTTERELNTQVRVRPGDMLLIAGMVREGDKLSKDGPGLSEPFIPSSRSTSSKNSELVFLMRPRVIVFTAADANTPRKGTISLPAMSMTTPMVQPTKSLVDGIDPIEEKDLEPADLRIVTPPKTPLASMAEQPISDEADMVSAPHAENTDEKVASELQFEKSSGVDDEQLQFLPRLADKVKAIKEKESEPSVLVNYDLIREKG